MTTEKPGRLTRKGEVLSLLLAAVLFLTVFSGCRKEPGPSPGKETSSALSAETTKQQETKQQTASEAASFSSLAGTTLAPSTSAAALQKSSARKAAEKRIKSDVDLALWYVKENKRSGSKVSFPYEKGNTAYSGLSKAQKELYNEMLPKVKELTAFEYTAKKDGYTTLDNVLVASSALCKDYPEYELYFDIKEVFSGDMTTGLKSVYSLPGDSDAKNVKNTAKIKKELEIFEEECNLIVESIPKSFSTYDKYRYLAAVISIRTAYDNDFEGGKPTMTAYGAIQGPVAICQGYSTAFEYLCRKANLWCKQVSGVSQGVSHAWNLVKLKGGTYHVDVTWADSDLNLTLDEGWQRYFMLTQTEILEDHEIDDGTVATGKSLRPKAAG